MLKQKIESARTELIEYQTARLTQLDKLKLLEPIVNQLIQNYSHLKPEVYIDCQLSEAEVRFVLEKPSAQELSYLANEVILLTDSEILHPDLINVFRSPGSLRLQFMLSEDNWCRLNVRFYISHDQCKQVQVGTQPVYKTIC